MSIRVVQLQTHKSSDGILKTRRCCRRLYPLDLGRQIAPVLFLQRPRRLARRRLTGPPAIPILDIIQTRITVTKAAGIDLGSASGLARTNRPSVSTMTGKEGLNMVTTVTTTTNPLGFGVIPGMRDMGTAGRRMVIVTRIPKINTTRAVVGGTRTVTGPFGRTPSGLRESLEGWVDYHAKPLFFGSQLCTSRYDLF